jgi:hypothetical protein
MRETEFLFATNSLDDEVKGTSLSVDQSTGEDPTQVEDSTSNHYTLSMKVTELRAACEQKGLPSGGTKAILLQRLAQSQDSESASSPFLEKKKPAVKKKVAKAGSAVKQTVDSTSTAAARMAAILANFPECRSGGGAPKKVAAAAKLRRPTPGPATVAQGLELFKQLGRDDRNREGLDGAEETILAAMAQYPDSEAVQTQGCGALWNVTGGDLKSLNLVARKRGLHALLAAMKAHPTKVLLQRYALGLLRELLLESERFHMSKPGFGNFFLHGKDKHQRFLHQFLAAGGLKTVYAAVVSVGKHEFGVREDGEEILLHLLGVWKGSLQVCPIPYT